MKSPPSVLTGAVVIGRNEELGLHVCLKSIQKEVSHLVYVDSGSTDNSCAIARACGAAVVELDLLSPFTAARARQAGFEQLRATYPDVAYVQFVDGDCEVVAGWIEAAVQALDEYPDVVAVCGWRRERSPEHSLFNRICDMEWRIGPVGEITNFGGDVMIREDALTAAGGYNPRVIAAEDDELGVRLRQNDGKLLRIDQDSTLHDANIHHLSQWWRRAKRCGYAFAQVFSIHGAPPERKFVKEVKRTLLWGGIVPSVALLLALPTHGLSLLLFGRYPLTALRTAYGMWRRGFSWLDSLAWGVSCGVSVFPEVTGMMKFHFDRLRNKQFEIIEYKGPQTPAIKV